MKRVTAASKRHLERIHQLRCVVCLNRHDRSRPCVEAHHVEAYRGEHSDFATVPLCRPCHQLLHEMHRKSFCALYHTDDVMMLAWTIRELMR